MAKKTDVADPKAMDGPELAQFLTNKIDAVEIGVKAVLDSLSGMGQQLQSALQNDLQNIRPICEEFPGLCKKVDDLRKGIEEIKPSATAPISRVADNLAQHYKECDNPDCKRAIEARLKAVGFTLSNTPPQMDKPEDHKDPVLDPATTPEAKPWERVGVSESKYNRNKSYYNDVIRELDKSKAG